MNKPKVLIAMEKLSNLNSGLGQFCVGLGHALCEQQKKVDLYFLVPKNREGIFGINACYQKLKSYLSFLLNRPSNYQVWHCTHQESKFLPRKGKLIITIHDLNFLYKYKGLKKQWKLKALQRKVNSAAAVTAISKFTAEEIKRHLQIDEKKLHVIYNGVSVKIDDTAALPDMLKNQAYLFTIGIINPKKNFHVLLPLLKARKDLKLVIAGNNNHHYVQKIKELAHEMGVSSELHFLGMVSEPLKFALYQHCYAFVFPSLSEGFGLPVIEAMFFGKPVFLSNNTCLPEIGGKEVFYWKNFNAEDMLQVFESGMNTYQKDESKAARIRAHAAQFTWEKSAASYLSLYEHIVAEV
jgi:glycosyltransferase involved in cell wall biosynthesis